ncbi:CBS domain-containing protein [Nocardia takedensis]|uniref:CBS domain-containing protein n=1 Tax=Nocardia takedensis TaxID=259390 RepID=UPI00030C83EB|nr:CBS domain-containing protein [Nocardia takedensis]
MTTVRDIMRTDVQHIGVRDTMAAAAQQMRRYDIGALPICDGENHPVGIVTDRDIVVRVVGHGANPATTTAGEMAQGQGGLHTVEADTDIDDAIVLMEQCRIRRLPVTEDGVLAGIITEADLSRHLSENTVGEFVGAVCAADLPVRGV